MSEIVERPVVDTSQIEGQIMQKVVAKRRSGDGIVEISIHNYSQKPVSLTLFNLSPDSGADAKPRPDFIDTVGDEYNKVWKCTLEPKEQWRVRYSGNGGGSFDLRGVEDGKKVVVDLEI